MSSPRSVVLRKCQGPRRACPTSELLGVRSSFEPRHGEARQAGTSFASQAVTGRQAVYGASPSGLSTLRPDSLPSRSVRSTYTDHSVRRLSEALPVYAVPDQDICGVDMSPHSAHAVAV